MIPSTAGCLRGLLAYAEKEDQRRRSTFLMRIAYLFATMFLVVSFTFFSPCYGQKTADSAGVEFIDRPGILKSGRPEHLQVIATELEDQARFQIGEAALTVNLKGSPWFGLIDADGRFYGGSLAGNVLTYDLVEKSVNARSLAPEAAKAIIAKYQQARAAAGPAVPVRDVPFLDQPGILLGRDSRKVQVLAVEKGDEIRCSIQTEAMRKTAAAKGAEAGGLTAMTVTFKRDSAWMFYLDDAGRLYYGGSGQSMGVYEARDGDYRSRSVPAEEAAAVMEQYRQAKAAAAAAGK